MPFFFIPKQEDIRSGATFKDAKRLLVPKLQLGNPVVQSDSRAKIHEARPPAGMREIGYQIDPLHYWVPKLELGNQSGSDAIRQVLKACDWDQWFRIIRQVSKAEAWESAANSRQPAALQPTEAQENQAGASIRCFRRESAFQSKAGRQGRMALLV